MTTQGRYSFPLFLSHYRGFGTLPYNTDLIRPLWTLMGRVGTKEKDHIIFKVCDNLKMHKAEEYKSEKT